MVFTRVSSTKAGRLFAGRSAKSHECALRPLLPPAVNTPPAESRIGPPFGGLKSRGNRHRDPGLLVFNVFRPHRVRHIAIARKPVASRPQTPIAACAAPRIRSEESHGPIEGRLRANIRTTIKAVFEEELEEILGRCRYGCSGTGQKGCRNGQRAREIIGTFGSEQVSVPRARIDQEDGWVTQWRSKALPRYQTLR